MWQVHATALLFFLTLAAVLLVLFHTSTTVIGEGRQAKSIKNNVNGKIRIVLGGLHFYWPWEEILHDNIDLNLETWEMDRNTALRATARDGTAVLFQVRLKAATGRKCLPNGQSVDANQIDVEAVWRAATSTEPDKASRRRYILALFGVFDRILGHYSLEQMMRPGELSEADQPLVPPETVILLTNEAHLSVVILPVRTRTRSHFLDEIGSWAEQSLNFELRHSGFTVHEVRINDLRPADAKMRDAVRRATENRMRTAALHELPDEVPIEMKYLVGGDDQALAEAAKAAAWHKVGDKLIDRLSELFGGRGTP